MFIKEMLRLLKRGFAMKLLEAISAAPVGNMRNLDFLRFLYHFNQVITLESNNSTITPYSIYQSVTPIRDILKKQISIPLKITMLHQYHQCHKHINRPYTDYSIPNLFITPRFNDLIKDLLF